MKTIATVCAALVMVVGSASAQTPAKTAANVSGTWSVAVKGPAAHGDMQATMLLKQEGKAITGTFSVHGTEHALKGELADGTLSLETTDTPADKGLIFSARLKDDGSLAGYLSGPMGDMQWTATRGTAQQ